MNMNNVKGRVTSDGVRSFDPSGDLPGALSVTVMVTEIDSTPEATPLYIRFAFPHGHAAPAPRQWVTIVAGLEALAEARKNYGTVDTPDWGPVYLDSPDTTAGDVPLFTCPATSWEADVATRPTVSLADARARAQAGARNRAAATMGGALAASTAAQPAPVPQTDAF